MFISGLPFMTDCCLLLACHLNDGENTLEDVGKFYSNFLLSFVPFDYVENELG